MPAILGAGEQYDLIHVKSRRLKAGHHGPMSIHYHYLTLEQRDALEAQIRARTPNEPALRLALERLHQPDYGVCIECGKDIAFVRLQADPDAVHCADCARLPVKR
jgi:RNA polymerase-binding transcription factor DksA